MSRFVQGGTASFEDAKPDFLPDEKDRSGTFHVLLRSGFFSVARLTPNHYGGFVWQYPIHPIEWLGGEGVWQPNEVVAWSRRI
jgi:hypothetical protein